MNASSVTIIHSGVFALAMALLPECCCSLSNCFSKKCMGTLSINAIAPPTSSGMKRPITTLKACCTLPKFMRPTSRHTPITTSNRFCLNLLSGFISIPCLYSSVKYAHYIPYAYPCKPIFFNQRKPSLPACKILKPHYVLPIRLVGISEKRRCRLLIKFR